MPNFVQNPLGKEVAVISSGSSLSSGVDLGGLRLFGIVMPSSWDAADITFQASYDGGVNWHDLYGDKGSEVSVVAQASSSIIVDPATFASVPMIKVRSGTAAAAINQTSGANISLILRSV